MTYTVELEINPETPAALAKAALAALRWALGSWLVRSRCKIKA
jgi:hypothetical protein